jgi:hypothetical protein
MLRWRIAQSLALAATLALIPLLVVAPGTGLRVLWDVAIPILPAVFLIQPALWRNLCPLATINTIGNRWSMGLVVKGRVLSVATWTGIVLLAVMVPARRFLFNSDGPVLAAVIAAVALLALVAGLVFDKKAGFCSGICPVLPVERLYGQSPLGQVSNPRCTPCTLCTAPGCIDLSQSKSIPQLFGPRRKSHAWLQTGFGVFAAGFPGFVLGYNLTRDGDLATAGTVYLAVGVAVALSYLLTQLVVRTLHLSSTVSIRILGTIAIALYYWFAAATVSANLSLPDWSPAAIRLAAFGLIGIWLWRAMPPSPKPEFSPS